MRAGMSFILALYFYRFQENYSMAQITTLEQLQLHYKAPHPVVVNKGIHKLEPHTKTFINNCPFLLISTISEQGHIDVSPRGGSAGFIKILNDQSILIGDLPGNNRIDSLRNILYSPEVGILFLIPGINEVIRLRGTASIHDDEEFLITCTEFKKSPKLVIKVIIKEIFFHCPKSMLVSKLWSPEMFQDRDILPSLSEIIKDQLGL
jgi:PPOX class probable FMN-dependent enzyme